MRQVAGISHRSRAEAGQVPSSSSSCTSSSSSCTSSFSFSLTSVARCAGAPPPPDLTGDFPPAQSLSAPLHPRATVAPCITSPAHAHKDPAQSRSAPAHCHATVAPGLAPSPHKHATVDQQRETSWRARVHPHWNDATPSPSHPIALLPTGGTVRRLVALHSLRPGDKALCHHPRRGLPRPEPGQCAAGAGRLGALRAQAGELHRGALFMQSCRGGL